MKRRTSRRTRREIGGSCRAIRTDSVTHWREGLQDRSGQLFIIGLTTANEGGGGVGERRRRRGRTRRRKHEEEIERWRRR